ncbi:phasin family protein [Altererythrobacter sp.]|uniref:phasin family protein n=1 Tax=Altererythrobacter sp. TaxID=1872480 RepID=UPI003D0254C4
MADNAKSKIDAAAEKAYAEAAAKSTASEKAAEKPVEAPAPVAAAKVEPAPKAAAKAPAKKSAPKKKVTAKKKVVAKPAPAKKPVAKKAAPKKIAAKKPAPKKAAVAAKTTETNPVVQIKDKIMATAKTKEFTKTAKELAADVQAKLKSAYAKTSEYASEVTEFNKGNAEAVVEAGKIFAAGVQELGREDVEAGKSAFETVTADVKKMVAVKSPTELMQLQGELARRNFDAAVSYGSKRTEALVKLYNDAFAPLSSRVSLAAEKIKKAA